MRRTARDVEIDGHDRVGAVVDLGVIDVGAAGDRAGADGDDDLRRRRPRRRSSRARARMFSVTGPVTSRPSAWRGEATNWMPKRPRSKTDACQHVDVGLAAVAAAGAHLAQLQRAAEQRAALRRRAPPRGARRRARRPPGRRACAPPGGGRRAKAIAPVGQALAHSVQKRQRPRSTRERPVVRARWRRSGRRRRRPGSPSAQRAASITGRPRKRSGSAGAGPSG